MIRKVVAASNTYESWRDIARECLSADVEPSDIIWSLENHGSEDLFSSTVTTSFEPGLKIYRVPRTFLELAKTSVCHSDPQRFHLLYQLLVACVCDARILENPANPLVSKLSVLSKSVARDVHKMKAFVRFRENSTRQSVVRKFVAWFEPEHRIAQHSADFFARRFHDMDWCIATPKGSAMFMNKVLRFDALPAQPHQAVDDTEELWKIYYANIFNPARLKLRAMASEMPRKYWHNLPEAVLIPDLIASAQNRSDAMQKSMPTTPPKFSKLARAPSVETAQETHGPFSTIVELNSAARRCRRCALYCNATQTVVGEGIFNAKLMVVGEQPGDEEDLGGRPFIGPAGKLFDEALKAAAIDRNELYVTNAVKHFKYEPRGKRRIHQRPNAGEIQHCKYWLMGEIALIKPKLILAMGATAAGALTDFDKNVTARRGKIEHASGLPPIMITFHPSAILRTPDVIQCKSMREQFFSDIARAYDLSVGNLAL